MGPRRVRTLAELDAEERSAVAGILPDVARRIRADYGTGDVHETDLICAVWRTCPERPRRAYTQATLDIAPRPERRESAEDYATRLDALARQIGRP